MYFLKVDVSHEFFKSRLIQINLQNIICVILKISYAVTLKKNSGAK